MTDITIDDIVNIIFNWNWLPCSKCQRRPSLYFKKDNRTPLSVGCPCRLRDYSDVNLSLKEYTAVFDEWNSLHGWINGCSTFDRDGLEQDAIFIQHFSR